MPATDPAHPTKQRLIEVGMPMLLKHGYNDLGMQALLQAAQIPKGSFYHHFVDKEDFALQVIDAYMQQVHLVLDATLSDERRAPLDRVRGFFEQVRESYRQEGYMGCLLGGLGQELSGVSEVFQQKVARCFREIAARLAGCLDEAKRRGDVPRDSDTRRMADLLVDCWEGAALRSRLVGRPQPLEAMLDFFFQSVATPRMRYRPAGQRAAAPNDPGSHAPALQQVAS